jgi:CRISPR/Cas system CSM-associated protein Csm3 (group 7 of RAMP superfamily)
MARKISTRLKLSGSLTTRTPLHVGGTGDDSIVDMPLAQNGCGEWYVPGTSLAGPLRHWCERAFGSDDTDQVWGYQGVDRGKPTGHASFVDVQDAVIDNQDRVFVETRDGVGIDREWGCAAEHIKFDRAVLPRGVTLPLELTVDVPSPIDRPRALGMFAAVLDELAGERLRLGGAKTRGLGRVALSNLTYLEEEMSNPAGMLARLRGDPGRVIGPEELRAARAAFVPRRAPRLDVTIRWRPAGPLMVKSAYEGLGVDMLPLVSRIESGLALVLPGSSIKGAVRSQAERIVRTLLYPDSAHSAAGWKWEDPKKAFTWKRIDKPREKFLHDVDVPLVRWLFGDRGRGPREAGQAGGNDGKRDAGGWRLPRGSPKRGLAALAIDDCYATVPIPDSVWDQICAAGADLSALKEQPGQPLPVTQAIDNAGLTDWTAAFHVAVDRWTGGAADQFLFTVLEPHNVAWEPLRLTIDFGRLRETDRLPATALLWLVLRDLCMRRIPLGFATNRGMGEVEIESIEFDPHDLGPDMAWFEPCTVAGSGGASPVPPPALPLLNRAWQAWLARERCRAMEPDAEEEQP